MSGTDVGQILRDLGEGELSKVMQVAVDQALLLDSDGIIREVLAGGSPVPGIEDWVGRDWRSTVTGATRPKVERLLEEIAETGVTRFRQVNHPVDAAPDVPIGYTIVRIGSNGSLLAIGRNLEALANLQRQLVDAQQSMESEYWHVRQAEARYRLLFQQSVEPIFLIDADGMTISDANNAAGELFGTNSSRLVGRAFPPVGLVPGPTYDDEARSSFADTLEQLMLGSIDRATLDVRVGDSDRRYTLTANVVRFDGSRTLLIRLQADGQGAEARTEGLGVLDLLDHSPDGFVVTDVDGTVLFANRAFVNMTQVASEQMIVGRSLGLWLGRPGADLTVLLTQLREKGQIRLFATEIESEHGIGTPVEISAVAALDAEVPVLGITLRDVGRRLQRAGSGVRNLDEAVRQLSDKVGEVSLKQLVEDTVGLVELHFIDAALQLTGDNRTAAAELLGLSRQSLYTKLKRYNLDSNADD